MRHKIACLVLLAGVVSASRLKRQADTEVDEDEVTAAICAGKGPGEWFRLNPGAATCRDVVQCTDAGLQQIRCPSGLVFDIDKQTCDWQPVVKNCERKEKERKTKPLLNTDEPLCQANFLACGDGTCMEQAKFCDGEFDCADKSDENACSASEDPNRAGPCDLQACVLPDCFCSETGEEIPDNLPVDDIPQMITITFDDAINNNNIPLYNRIFNRARLNPNGCDIKATFFVSHKYTNYSAVQDFHRRGHEIAVHSISHNETDNGQFWSDATVDELDNEMAGARAIIEKFADIQDGSVLGMRLPYLRVGGNNQFRMMESQQFLYDSTITAPLRKKPLWPYTLYYAMPHSCHGNLQKCPTRSYAVWEMVMNELDRRDDPEVDDDLPGCAMVDSCSNIQDGLQFYNFLNNNFDRHYKSNKAPLGLYFHAAWLQNNPELEDVLVFWIEEILDTFDDVYFTTMSQTISWMQNPQRTEETKTFAPWQSKCLVEGEPFCYGGNNCALTSPNIPSGETFRMQTCQRCPNYYPWLGDNNGNGIPDEEEQK